MKVKVVHVVILVLVAAATAAVMALWRNITERRLEARQVVFPIVSLDEDTIDPAEWGKNYPRQHDTYRRTVDVERTRHGGSDAFQKLDQDPRWRVLFEGYPFGTDYREERGHAFMLEDQEQTERVTKFSQPGACLHCHASVIPAYRAKGREAGVPDERRAEQIHRGFEIVNPLPYAEARRLVQHPIACIDCHDPATMAIRALRPAFLEGIARLAASEAPTPHLPSIARWRTGSRAVAYDPNVEASRQEMRSMVCGQCHVEYYFKGPEKLLTYPWHEGLGVDAAERYYDAVGWKDWAHPRSGAPVLKAQHPEFELWSEGIHARAGVSCADCHMPYVREGAIKVSDHHVRSPLLNAARSCQPCHNVDAAEMRARAEAIQDRTRALMLRAEEATIDLIAAIESARAGGASEGDLAAARERHRKAQWRLDYIAAENSMGFHADQESARILGEAIDEARQGFAAALLRGAPRPAIETGARQGQPGP
jgi:nitrite reductase (cytochrome c-552)